ncbi:MAG: tetratricopeptide repeat protein [Thermoplasmata archaeon]
MDIGEDDLKMAGEALMKGIIIHELARSVSLWSTLSLVAIREARPEDFEKKDALQWYQAELDKKPNDKSLWYAMGTLLAKRGLYDKALEAFGRVTWLDPLHLKAWDAKAKALLRLERYQEALECLDRATELETGDERIWFQKGEALLKLRRFQEALDCYDKAIEIDPNYSDAWYGRGQALREIEKKRSEAGSKGPRVKAQSDDVEGVESRKADIHPPSEPSEDEGPDPFLGEPRCPEMGKSDDADENDCLLAANMQRYAGKTESALRLYDEAIRLNPDFLDAWYLKGTLLYIMDRYEEALECFDKVLLLNPEHEWAQKRKAEIETLANIRRRPAKTSPSDAEREETRGEDSRAGRPGLAVAHAFKESWGRISDKENLLRKADECYDAGEYDIALAYYDNVLEIDRDEYRAWKRKGEILSMMDRNEEATECFEKALKLNPKDETIWHGEGRALRAEGKTPEALVALKKAVYLKPELAEAWHEAGVLLRALGRTSASHKALQEAFNLYFLRTLRSHKEEGTSSEKESEAAILEMEPQENLPDKGERKASIDREDRRILMAVWNRAKTVSQISKQLGIPIAECYKRVKNLRSMGLLTRLRFGNVLDPERKTIDLYKLDSREGTIVAKRGKLILEIPLSTKKKRAISDSLRRQLKGFDI